MWRRSNLPGNPDSDQSISEEEDEQSYISLVENENGKEEEGGLLLQTKLEKLIGCGTETGDIPLEATLRKIPISSSLEDDVEVPDSQEESYVASERLLPCISAQENVSDNEVIIQDDDEVPQDEEPVATTWSTISKETESLIHLNGIASVSSSHRSGFRTKRVVKDNVRPKFSFHSYTLGETSSKISDMAENLEEPVIDMAIDEEDPIAECPHDSEEAISKILDAPTEKIRVAKRNSKPYCRHERKSARKGSFSSVLQDNNATDDDDDDELHGAMDSESSSSSTDNDESLSLVADISNQKKQFVGDRFDEAIKASSLLFGSPKLSGGSSLYGKLQQIMKQEKETEIEMAKKLQSGIIKQTDASSYIDVRIMSRQLEAKLIVCKCSVIDADSLLFKTTQVLAEKETETTTIIFNTKVCADVDIETGRFIRVYAPWKEMVVKKKTNENIWYKICPWKSEAEVKRLGYKVHGIPTSTNTRRVLAVMFEKGLCYEPITVDLKAGEHKTEHFLSLNPFGQVPVFEDGNVKLCESRAITQYLAYVHLARGTQLLNLQSHAAMATLTMWLEIEAHQFDPFASKLTWEQVIKPIYNIPTDHDVVKANEDSLEKVLDVYEKRLGVSKFLACDTFSLVDLHHLPTIQYLLGTPTKRLFENRPKVNKWVKEITNREAWKMACDQDKSWFDKQRK